LLGGKQGNRRGSDGFDLIDRVTERRFGADRIALMHTRRRVIRNWRCAGDGRRPEGAKPATAEFGGLAHAVLKKRRALLLLAAQISVLQRHPPALLLLFLAREHVTASALAHPGAAALERNLDELRTTVIKLRHELTNKEGYAATLELVLRQRMERIDQLNGQLEQVREQNRRLDAEAERLAEMVRLS